MGFPAASYFLHRSSSKTLRSSQRCRCRSGVASPSWVHPLSLYRGSSHWLACIARNRSKKQRTYFEITLFVVSRPFVCQPIFGTERRSVMIQLDNDSKRLIALLSIVITG